MQESSLTLRVFRFGIFEVDLRAAELRKSGIKIKLQEQPFQILVMLLEHPGGVVTREELRKRLWSADTFVDFDHSLNKAINKLREALSDSAENPRFVETLPRRGYRFNAPIEEAGRALLRDSSAQVQSDSLPRHDWTIPLRPAVLTASVLAGLLALLVALNVGGWRERLWEGPDVGRIRSIAVLPLENLTDDPAQEYFADGMTDALITDLAQAGSLRVMSRTSVMRYKGTRKPLPQVASELNVDGIVEGTVQRSGNRVRIDAQLIHAATDRHLWARSYERDLPDIVALQGEVARAIATEVQAKLTPHELTRLANTRTVKPEAYEAYLRGRYFWNKRSEEALKKGIEYFLQSIENDPTYAQAYVGLADSYIVLGYNLPSIDPREAYLKAKPATLKALELDPELAEAHASLANIKAAYEWDYSGGEKEWQQAIELNPNYAIAHYWYSVFLANKGRFDEATAQIRRAHELDPLSLVISTGLGAQLYYQRRFDEAIDGLRKALVLDPNFIPAHLNLGRAYEQKAMYREAVGEFQRAVPISQANPECLEGLGHTYAVSGDRTKALTVLGELNRLSKQRYVSAYSRVIIYAGLGEKEQAFAWLERAYREHASRLAFLKVDPRLDPLRSDRRFRELLQRIGIP